MLAVFQGTGAAYPALPVDHQLLINSVFQAGEEAPIAQWTGAVVVESNAVAET